MFLESSRYYKEKVKTVMYRNGDPVIAAGLRILSSPAGVPFQIKGNHRLDILSHTLYKDSSLFWHIADANTELEAHTLVEEAGMVINVPEM